MRHLTLTAVIATLLIVGAQACGGMEEDLEGTIEGVSQAVQLPPDKYEPNNSPPMATHLPPITDIYQRLTITANDEDWYHLEKAPGQDLLVKIKFKHSDANLELAVFKDCWRTCQLVRLANSNTDNEVLFLSGLRARELWVTTFDHGGSARYDMEIRYY